jgi:uncharacterized protein (DUF433 family)
MGGEMCILGTRIPIRLLYWMCVQGMSIEEIMFEYPHLTKDQVVDSIERVKWAISRDLQRRDAVEFAWWHRLGKKAWQQWCKENPP